MRDERPEGGLDAALYRDRLQGYHALTTLLLVAMLQVTAMAFGAQHAFALRDSPAGLDASALIYLDVAFMCLVTTCFYYLHLASLVFIPPTLTQYMIPFTTGVAELVLVRTFHDPRWFLPAYLLFLAASAAGFLYVRANLRSESFDHSFAPAYGLIDAECRKNILCLGAMAITTLAVYWHYPEGSASSLRHDLTVVGINGVLFTIMILITELKFLPRLYKLADVR